MTLQKQVTLKEQVFFYLPLAATSFIIIITHTFFNAGLARLPNPEVMIAAFAVAKSLMHVFQSPVMMIRQTVTALIDHHKNFRKTLIFLSLVVGCVVFMLGMTAFSGLSRWLFTHVMGLEGQTLDEAVTMLKILFLFPLMVSVRDFFTGISIRFRTVPLITAASVVRVIYVMIFIALIDQMTALPGAILAGLMFIGGVAIEALVMVVGTRIFNWTIPRKLAELDRQAQRQEPRPLSYRMIFGFYSPLIVTTVVYNTVMPIVNSGLARSSQPELALSVFAVAWGLGFVVLSPFNMLHQVPLKYIGTVGNGNARAVRLFMLLTAVASAAALALISFTGLGYYILRYWIGTSHEISLLAADVLKFMCVSPFLLAAREYYWGILLKRRKTRFIWQGKTISLLVLLLVLLLTLSYTPANAAIIGVVCIISGEAAESLFLLWIFRRHLYERVPSE